MQIILYNLILILMQIVLFNLILMQITLSNLILMQIILSNPPHGQVSAPPPRVQPAWDVLPCFGPEHLVIHYVKELKQLAMKTKLLR